MLSNIHSFAVQIKYKEMQQKYTKELLKKVNFKTACKLYRVVKMFKYNVLFFNQQILYFEKT